MTSLNGDSDFDWYPCGSCSTSLLSTFLSQSFALGIIPGLVSDALRSETRHSKNMWQEMTKTGIPQANLETRYGHTNTMNNMFGVTIKKMVKNSVVLVGPPIALPEQ